MESNFKINQIGSNKKDLRGTWSQGFISLFAPIFIILAIRWGGVEPFVVPSGSMIPTLLIHDHLVATKFSFGLRLPFTNDWLIKWDKPNRGEVVVFHYPKNPELYFVKRIVGLPHDKISVQNGVLFVNGQPQLQNHVDTPPDQDSDFNYYEENNHLVRYISPENSNFDEIEVPENSYFAMGDNRDQSSDSRVWGFVPEELLVGRVSAIWLSCEQTLASASFLCDPSTIRWNRLLKIVK